MANFKTFTATQSNTQQTPTAISVIVTECKNKTTGKKFLAFKTIADGKKVDLRFKRGVDVSIFDGVKRCNITCGYVSEVNTTSYEYPRVYADNIDVDTLEIIE